jgi:hypothetical protein
MYCKDWGRARSAFLLITRRQRGFFSLVAQTANLMLAGWGKRSGLLKQTVPHLVLATLIAVIEAIRSRISFSH